MAEETTQAQEHAPAVEKVTLRHPLTGDTQVVDGLPEVLIPIMGAGYQQVKGA